MTSDMRDGWPIHGRIDGAVVIIGYGSIGRGTLPLIQRHFDFDVDRLMVIEPDPVAVADLAARALESPLPLIGGDGADHVVDEALAIHAAAAPLADRLLGLVRIGERRWDVVLQDGRRILLPEQGAVQALDRALGLHDATDILNRDVVRLDLRDAERVSVTLSPAAMEALRQERIRARANPTGEQSG